MDFIFHNLIFYLILTLYMN